MEVESLNALREESPSFEPDGLETASHDYQAAGDVEEAFDFEASERETVSEFLRRETTGFAPSTSDWADQEYSRSQLEFIEQTTPRQTVAADDAGFQGGDADGTLLYASTDESAETPEQEAVCLPLSLSEPLLMLPFLREVQSTAVMDDDLIVVEDAADAPAAPQTMEVVAPPGPARVERQEYKQLFARLRRGKV